jgi:hypothetical protein
MEQYSGLFKTKKKGKDKPSRYDDFGGQQLDDRYKWLAYIEIFIEKLNLKETEVYVMNYIHTLNWLGYWKNKNDVKSAKEKNSL